MAAEVINEFFALGSDSKLYTIVVTRTPVQRRPALGGRGAGVQGPSMRYHTSDGQPVDRLPDGASQIQGTDITLTPIDPNDPSQHAP